MNKIEFYECENEESLYKCIVTDNCRIVADENINTGTVVYQGAPFLKLNYGKGQNLKGLDSFLESLEIVDIVMLDLELETLYPFSHEDILNCVSKTHPKNNKEVHEDMANDDICRIIEKIEQNKFGVGKWSHVYIKGSKFNHSCVPNCIYEINANHMTIRAGKNIFEREELTICYYWSPNKIPHRDARKKFLSGRFKCWCELCASLCEITFLRENIKSVSSSVFHNPTSHCDNCGLFSKNIMTCSNCKVSVYCNKVCQKEHWKNGHKFVCGCL